MQHMHRKILYFINPVSGTRPKASLQKLIIEKTREQNIPFEIFTAEKDGHYPYLKEKIKKDKVTDVVVCGGDGTINKITAALLNVDIKIGVIPAGSGNGLALSAKIPKQSAKALQLIFNGKPCPV